MVYLFINKQTFMIFSRKMIALQKKKARISLMYHNNLGLLLRLLLLTLLLETSGHLVSEMSPLLS